MTKEPIMIDDVDVSECEFFSSGLEYCTIGLLADDGTHICKCEQNCHYKQLKRKEQECEELKKSVRSNKDKRKKAIERYLKLKEFTNKEFKKLKAKKQECEYAQRQVDYFKDLYSQENDNKVALEQEREELLTKIDIQKRENIIFTLETRKLVVHYSSKLERLKQALQEIKKIAEDECKNCIVKLLGEDEINCKRCYKTKILKKCEVPDGNQ